MSVSVGALSRMPFSTSLAVISLPLRHKTRSKPHPLRLTLSDLIQLLFHRGGKAVIHQVVEIFHQPVGHQLIFSA